MIWLIVTGSDWLIPKLQGTPFSVDLPLAPRWLSSSSWLFWYIDFGKYMDITEAECNLWSDQTSGLAHVEHVFGMKLVAGCENGLSSQVLSPGLWMERASFYLFYAGYKISMSGPSGCGKRVWPQLTTVLQFIVMSYLIIERQLNLYLHPTNSWQLLSYTNFFISFLWLYLSF